MGAMVQPNKASIMKDSKMVILNDDNERLANITNIYPQLLLKHDFTVTQSGIHSVIHYSRNPPKHKIGFLNALSCIRRDKEER